MAKELVICKTCKFVMKKSALGDKCPACGVPAKMFEDYTDNVSDLRSFFISLDMHPVFAHFPQAFTFTVLLLSIVCLLVQEGGVRELLVATLKTLGICLPFTVALTFAAGLFDGRIRFKRLRTPLLLKKIVIGAFFMVMSTGGAVLILFKPISPSVLCGITALSFGSFLCSVALGLLGVKLLNAKLPG